MILAKASIDKIIRKAGAHRVSSEAAICLAKMLEEEGIEISKEAVELAEHAGRKTIKKEDIKLAIER
ncbi:MAG: histone family protein [Candidatus Methanofastidiosia archaeon]